VRSCAVVSLCRNCFLPSWGWSELWGTGLVTVDCKTHKAKN
jgi:hypothetical protein